LYCSKQQQYLGRYWDWVEDYYKTETYQQHKSCPVFKAMKRKREWEPIHIREHWEEVELEGLIRGTIKPGKRPRN
jgi:hypothetical protein